MKYSLLASSHTVICMVDALELDKSIYRVGTSKMAELEEQRDAPLFDIFLRLQARVQMWTARRQMKKVLNRASVIRIIQRNARVYGYTKVCYGELLMFRSLTEDLGPPSTCSYP